MFRYPAFVQQVRIIGPSQTFAVPTELEVSARTEFRWRMVGRWTRILQLPIVDVSSYLWRDGHSVNSGRKKTRRLPAGDSNPRYSNGARGVVHEFNVLNERKVGGVRQMGGGRVDGGAGDRDDASLLDSSSEESPSPPTSSGRAPMIFLGDGSSSSLDSS